MMEPHMIENYIHYVFVFEFNHVGFIISMFYVQSSDYNIYPDYTSDMYHEIN